jgi:hypothetical protein
MNEVNKIQTTTAAEQSYAVIMQAVNDPACDPAKLRELLAVRREWMADESARAFNAAVVAFQQQAGIIKKADSANGRPYARIDRIWREVRPIMQACGLAVTFESVRTNGETCILDGHVRHATGHAQAIHHEIPLPQAIPGQNAAQRAGSAETYAKRYATCAALGIQTGDDDDGNAGRRVTTDEKLATLDDLKRITAARTKHGRSADAVREIVRVVAGVEDAKHIPADKVDAIIAEIAKDSDLFGKDGAS